MAKSRKGPEDDEPRRRAKEDDEPRRKKRAAVAEEDDEDDEEEEIDRPRKKRKSTGKGARIVKYTVGGILGSIGLTLLMYWIYSSVGIDDDMLCYAPESTWSVEGADIEELEKNSKMTEVVNSMLSSTWKATYPDKFQQEITEKVVSKYLLCRASAEEDEKDLEPQRRRGYVHIIKFRKEVDQDKFHSAITGRWGTEDAKSADGKPYKRIYRITTAANTQGKAYEESYFFPTSKILVLSSTWKETEIALNAVPGKISLKDDMLYLARKVDGHAYVAHKGMPLNFSGTSGRLSMRTGVVDEEFTKRPIFSTGSARWFASNGNDFLYGEGVLYPSPADAHDARRTLSANFEKARQEIYAGDDNTKPSGYQDPFDGKSKDGGAPVNPQTKDVTPAVVEFIKNTSVIRRGRMVVVQGTVNHEKFGKFWAVMGGRIFPTPQSFGGGFGGFPPGGFGPGGGGPPPPVGPPGAPR